MPRPLRRFIPNQVNEITIRTVDARWSLVPVPMLRSEWIGILAEAGRRWPAVLLHDFQVMRSHATYHLSSGDANAVGKWTSFVNAATARASQFHHGLKGRIWGRRYHAIPILDDEALRTRTKYLMAQACAADAVTAPRRWPGPHAVDAKCRGVELKGSYVTAEARREALREHGELPVNRTLVLAPLPGLAESEQQRRTWYRAIEQEIVEEARMRHRAEGVTCGPPEALCREDPRYAPEEEEGDPAEEEGCGPAPICHTACRDRRDEYRTVRDQFIDAWRGALEDFKRGLRVCFPPGGWWPFHCRDVVVVPRV